MKLLVKQRYIYPKMAMSDCRGWEHIDRCGDGDRNVIIDFQPWSLLYPFNSGEQKQLGKRNRNCRTVIPITHLGPFFGAMLSPIISFIGFVI